MDARKTLEKGESDQGLGIRSAERRKNEYLMEKRE
jgi:hypothetical protein